MARYVNEEFEAFCKKDRQINVLLRRLARLPEALSEALRVAKKRISKRRLEIKSEITKRRHEIAKTFRNKKQKQKVAENIQAWYALRREKMALEKKMASQKRNITAQNDALGKTVYMPKEILNDDAGGNNQDQQSA